MLDTHDIIVAPATAPGGAIAIVRLSGEGSIALCDRIFRGKARLAEAPSHTLHYGNIVDGGELLDDAVVALFRAPHSYTGDESAEISCHGSRYIVRRILDLLLRLGARMASPGEFTARAYLAGRMDLSQAEAVADLIAADSQAAHRLAATQMRGSYSERLGSLQEELLQLSSLLVLELDFSEEEVEFADRSRIEATMRSIGEELRALEESFALGNALREGVAVAIIGEPNVGKSTLLNRLVGDRRALVSEIAGTTRDTIEECVDIEGVRFRFIDTAGLHATDDRLERMGIERTRQAIERAHILLHLVDATHIAPPATAEAPAATGALAATGAPAFPERQEADASSLAPSPASELREENAAPEPQAENTASGPQAENTASGPQAESAAPSMPKKVPAASAATYSPANAEGGILLPLPLPLTPDGTPITLRPEQHCLTVVNKIDCAAPGFQLPGRAFGLSAKTGLGMSRLLHALRTLVDTSGVDRGDAIVSNERHAEALRQAREALQRALDALRENLPADLLYEEIRQVTHHLGTITGTITSDDILTRIFSKFCIGK